jgi:GNAT superfamily N-acetyltransferase
MKRRSRGAPQKRIADTTVAVVDGQIAGFVMVVDNEVEQVYVDRRWRGSTVAAALLDEAERRIAAPGHRQAWLAVFGGNARARRFYERHRWVDGGEADHSAEGRHDGPPIIVQARRYTKVLET